MDSALEQRAHLNVFGVEFLSNHKTGSLRETSPFFAGLSPTGGAITIFFKPAVVIFRFLNRLTSLTAQQMNNESQHERKYEICVISRFWPDASVSFSYSFFLMKAYTNLHESILTSIGIYFFKRFSLRFLLFSSLSFLVNGLSLALLIPNSNHHSQR